MPGVKRDKIRVIIAEDQAMVLGALAALLEMEDDIEVVARARSLGIKPVIACSIVGIGENPYRF